ncbi:MAG: hypothetical protein IKC26_00695 [Clostridia bacterium]|nr:hypothetical protein [Clostridia bacterium]
MKKTLITILATVLVCACIVGGTVAWLIDQTDSIENTFTVGNVDIELTETTGNTYKMIPGSEIEKNPEVTVEEGSESCWLFVKIDETNNTFGTDNSEKYITYTPADGWTMLKAGIYYRQVLSTDTTKSFSVFANDKVSVNEKITKAQADTLDESSYPKLTLTAYAIQSANTGNVTEAWEKLETAITTTP